jgi:hypothetical protein
MATMIAADVEAALPFEIRRPHLLSRAYNAIFHRAGRDLPIPVAEMSDNFELRNRVQSGQSSRLAVGNGESSPESSQPLTPISSGEQEQEQAQSMYEEHYKMHVLNTGQPDQLYRGICTSILG